jgi:hypothetical protein
MKLKSSKVSKTYFLAKKVAASIDNLDVLGPYSGFLKVDRKAF